jgi:hypothetical protein
MLTLPSPRHHAIELRPYQYDGLGRSRRHRRRSFRGMGVQRYHSRVATGAERGCGAVSPQVPLLL